VASADQGGFVMSDEFSREQRIESLDYNEALKIVYQWVKEKVIYFKEFEKLVSCLMNRFG